jgi:hypothetical protein
MICSVACSASSDRASFLPTRQSAALVHTALTKTDARSEHRLCGSEMLSTAVESIQLLAARFVAL